MTRSRSSILALLLTATLAAGCSSVDQSAAPQVDPVNLAERKAKAYELTARGDLNAALLQWRILETLDDEDSEVVAKRKHVETRIRRLVKRHLQRGEQALAERDIKAAQTEFVLVLALEPANSTARDHLRKLELAQVRRKRPRKDDYVDTVPRKPAASVAAKSTPAQEAAKPAGSMSPAPAALAEEEMPAEPEARPPDTPEAQAETSSAELLRTAAVVRDEPAAEAVVAALEESPAQAMTSESLEQAKGLAQKGAYLDSIPLFLAHLEAFPEDEKAQDLLAISHREVGISLYRTGKLRESVDHLEAMASQTGRPDAEAADILANAKDQLARETYESGVRIFRDDVQQAIAFWHETLRYDPGHAKAQSYLAKAYKIQETLKALDQ